MRKKQRSAYLLESLEARLLFSADLAPLPVDAGTTGTEFESDLEISLQPDSVGMQEANEKTQDRREVIFVDSGVDDYQQLIDDIESQLEKGRQFDIVNLDSDSDGIDQISAYLKQHEGIDAVHVVSHGSQDAVKLGNVWLTSDKLDAFADAIEGWQHALSSEADLLFYGCNLAAGDGGQDLVNALTLLTGADVAASTDLTGHARLGGDWELEYQAGDIETKSFNVNGLQTWDSLLAVITVDTVNDLADGGDTTDIASLIATPGADGISLREAIIATNNDAGQADEIILNAGTYTLSLGELNVTDELTITGAGADVTVIDGNSLDRVFHLTGSNANLTLTDLTVQGGSISNKGGGIFVDDPSAQLTATRVIITGNIANDGAGIFNEGTINLTDVEISNNGDAGTNEGGGIHNKGSATLNGVTISGNRSDFGGGIHNDNTATSLSLTNVTVSGNTGVDTGGGLNNENWATINNATFTLNTASTGAGIFNQGAASDIDIRNTIVAGNLTNPDVEGDFNSLGNNLIGDEGSASSGFTDGVSGDQVGTSGSPIDPLLGSLQNNGGFTLTHLPLGGSPAIDAGTATGPPMVDQRGMVRPLDGDGDTTAAVDIGAVEVVPDKLVHVADSGDDQETSAENRGSHQAVAMAANGNYVVVWSSNNEDGSGWGVFGQRFDASGAAVGSKFQVNTTFSDNQRWATVAMDAAGNFVVIWTSDNQDGNIQSVYARGFHADGTEAFAEFKVNTYDASNSDEQRNPSIAMAADGRFVVAWEGVGPGESHGIFFRRFNADGSARDAADRPASFFDRGTETTPAVAINDSGDFAIVWVVNNNIYVRPFDDDGLPVRVENSINAFPFIRSAPDVAIDDIGGITVVWRSINGSHDGIWMQTYASDGTPDVHVQVDQNPSEDSTNPSITIDSAGNRIIVYEGSGDGDGLGVFARKFDAAGSALTDQFQINQTATGNQHMASAAMYDSDSFVVVWSGNGADDASGVYLRQFGTVTPTNNPGSVTIDNMSPAQGDTLTASVTDTDGATGAITYQWYRGASAIVGATSATYTTVQADVGSAITVTATYTDDLGAGESPTSVATAAVTNVNDTGSVAIDNMIPAQGDTLSASVSDPDGATGVISYQWYRGGVAITGATASTYTTVQADVGSAITVSATYTDDLGAGESPTSAATAAVTNVNDTGSVSIDNMSPAQGDTLTASVSDLDGATGAITYQWYRGASAIVGATSATYTTVQADVGAAITVSATYTDDLGAGESPTSAATAAVTNVNDTGSVTIDNMSPAQGDTLTASVSDLDGATGAIAYQWYRGASAIVGATSATYTTVQADVGSAITVTATYTDDLGGTESPTSAATAAVTNVNDTGSVTIDNMIPAQDDTLTASVSDPDGATGVISYQWYRGGVAITGATASTYTTVQADVGSAITVSATYTDDLGAGESPTSVATANVTNVNDTGSVTIDNMTPAQGDTLTASVTDPDGATGAITYQWYRGASAIVGATSATYTTVQADVGSAITVTATYTDDLGGAESPTSAATAAVTNVNDTGSVTIDNMIPAQGDTLTATVTDADGATGAITYQWYRGAAVIAGATSATYSTVQADVGSTITVTATYTDDLGASESPTSAATAAVTNVNDTGSVTIDNTTPAQGDTLTANVSDPDGTTGAISYQWYRGASVIAGATSATYTTVQADVGTAITVTATYTDDLGAGESPTSAATAAVTNVNDTGSVTIDNMSPAQGDTLTASVSDPDGATGVISYQWYRGGVAITGATASTYTTVQADVGSAITVTATYTDDMGGAESPTSAATTAVTNVNDTGSVTIDNMTPAQGDTLTASVTDPDGATGAITYQWYRGASVIVGANSATYTTVQADVGSAITVTATYTDDMGAGESPTSAATAAVTNTNDAGTVTIDNITPTQGDTLTANVIDLDGASGAITYQWFSGGAVIGGANGKTYTTTQSDVGTVISVAAIYNDDQGTAESLISTPTAPVTNVNDTPIAVNDNLNAIEDQSMTFTSVTDLLGNDSDIDGDTLTISSFSHPANGSLADNGDGTVTYISANNFSGVDSFTYTISDSNGGTATGAAIIVVTPVGDTPQVTNVSTDAGVQSGLINIDRNANDGAEVTYFKISGITNGTLYLADGVSQIDNGDFITVGQGQAGLRFTPSANNTADGSFNVESSEDGISVASQSGIATSIISILTTAPQPAEPVPSLPPSGPEEVVSEETELEETEELEDVADETDVQAITDDMASVEAPQNTKSPGIKKASLVPGISVFRRADLNSSNDRTPGRSMLLSPQTLKKLVESENLGELKTALRKLDITTLPPDVYELVRGSLDAVQEEMGKEILIGKTVVGSAIATSVGLSAGYVVWMLKGGSLMASVLSSLPAWQLADPLAILVGKIEDEEEEDDTLETIIKDGSRRNEDKKSKASELDKHKKESTKR